MIKIEHEVFPSPDQTIFVIEGIRNAHNSWILSDSVMGCHNRDGSVCAFKDCNEDCVSHCCNFILGSADKQLMKTLSIAGTDHRKFMRAMPVMCRITAPLYFWKEFDTYKVGTTSLSCSTMHTIAKKEFTVDDFSHEQLFVDGLYSIEHTVKTLNEARIKYLDTGEKDYWYQLIQLLPSSYNQTRNISMNYEVLNNMYHARKQHKLDEWREFCKWIETIPYSFLITGKE